MQAAAEWNAQLAAGEVHPSLWLKIKWFFIALVHLQFAMYAELERAWRDGGGRREPSIAWALNDVFGWTFWSGGIFKVSASTWWCIVQGKRTLRDRSLEIRRSSWARSWSE